MINHNMTCTHGIFMARERLAYRNHVHRIFTKDYDFEMSVLRISTWKPEDYQHYHSHNKQTNSEASLKLTDINNSAARTIQVREFDVNATENDSSTGTQTHGSKLLGIHKPIADLTVHTHCNYSSKLRCDRIDKTPDIRNIKEMIGAIATFNEHHRDPIATEKMKSKNTDTYRNSKDIDGNEVICSDMLEQVRQAQRFLRKEIKETEESVEIIHSDSKKQSDRIAAISDEIGHLKYSTITEAQTLEERLLMNGNLNRKPSVSFNTPRFTLDQLDRIKCVSVLNDCQRDILLLTQDIERDRTTSTDALLKEIHILNTLLAKLSVQRNDLIAIKVQATDVDTENDAEYTDETIDDFKNNGVISQSFGEIVNTFIKNTNQTKIEPDVLSYVDSLNHRRKTNGEEHGTVREKQHSDIEDLTRSEHIEKEIIKQRKKWEKLDMQYKKHTHKLCKRKDNLNSIIKSSINADESPSKSLFPKLPPIQIKQNLKGENNVFLRGCASLAKCAGENIKQLKSNIVGNQASKAIMLKCRFLDNLLISKIEQLRSSIGHMFERGEIKEKVLKDSVKTPSHDKSCFLNSMHIQYVEMKRKFRRRNREPASNADTEEGVNIVSRFVNHIRIFLQRVQLVAKFRNVLLFDREILLPTRRVDLTEWYDLPMAVAYGVNRFESSEVSFQSAIDSPRRRPEGECRFNIRVYGPLEYQLGRVLSEKERYWLNHEKYCILRNTHYQKGSRARMRHLKKISEANDNVCMSFGQCLWDCICGCKNDTERDTSDTERESETGSDDNDIENNMRITADDTTVGPRFSRGEDKFELRRAMATGHWDNSREPTAQDLRERSVLSEHQIGPPSPVDSQDREKTRPLQRERVHFNLDESMPTSRHD